MTNDEVPKSFATFVGHVCGVFAAAMAAACGYGIWRLAHKFTLGALVAIAIGIAIAALLFRWAGALTGYWDTSGRLSVPAWIYIVFGGLSASLSLFVGYLLIVDMPTSFLTAFVMWAGVLSGIALSYLCVLGAKRFK